MCSSTDDRFTVDSSTGNSLLTASVGLITADEVAMAGGKNGVQNNAYFLYNGSTTFWTMSPAFLYSNSAGAYEMYVVVSGNLGHSHVSASSVAIPPVINIDSSKVTYSDSGTYDNLYEV